MTDTALANRLRSHVRHPVLFVVIIAIAVRLWMLADLPLIITNDSVGYLTWGREFAAGASCTIPPHRVPGYSLFLAVAIKLLGANAFAVLLFQHALGVGTAAIAAFATCLRHGRGWGMGVGLLFAVAPDLWVWESYALTEAPALFLVIGALALAMAPGGGMRRGFALGLALGLGCLFRPAIQALVPFFALGWWLHSGSSKGPIRVRRLRRAAHAAAVIAGLAVSTGPWLIHNHARGVDSLATGGGLALWMGMCLSDSLDDAYPLPPGIVDHYKVLRARPVNDARVHVFLADIRAWSDPAVEQTLSAWVKASIATQPWRYSRGVAKTLVRLFQIHQPHATDVGYSLWRLSVDGRAHGQAQANFQISVSPATLGEFVSPAAKGPLARVCAWFGAHRLPGVPAVPLLACAVFALIFAVSHRRWGVAVVISGTLAFLGAHAALLTPWDRYTVLAWACWLLLMPDAIAFLARRLNRRTRSSPQGQPAA